MSSGPPTLESLMFAWGDAYIFAYARDRWIAIRRDGLLFLPAEPTRWNRAASGRERRASWRGHRAATIRTVNGFRAGERTR
jgi:hypothetical protein